MNIFKQKVWSPFLVGSLIGILMVFSSYFLGAFLGISSAFVKIINIILSLFDQNFIHILPLKEYFEIVVIVGVILGSLVSSYLSKSFIVDQVPSLWQKNFGSSFVKRAIFAFIGGIIIIFGARFAGGCTSGKAIASGLQLIISAWVFTGCLFFAAVTTSFILYRNK